MPSSQPASRTELRALAFVVFVLSVAVGLLVNNVHSLNQAKSEESASPALALDEAPYIPDNTWGHVLDERTELLVEEYHQTQRLVLNFPCRIGDEWMSFSGSINDRYDGLGDNQANMITSLLEITGVVRVEIAPYSLSLEIGKMFGYTEVFDEAVLALSGFQCADA